MPTASVCVRPGIAPATMMVAPNSPSARENPRIAPGDDAARRERQRDRMQDAERSGAQRGGNVLEARIDLLDARRARCARRAGKLITIMAITTAFHVKTTSMPAASSARPTGLRRPKIQSSTRPDATGGSTSGSETMRFEQRLAAELAPRQQPSDRDRRRQHQRDGKQGHQHGESRDGPRLGCHRVSGLARTRAASNTARAAGPFKEFEKSPRLGFRSARRSPPRAARY